jgi:AbrB family looped-hinge helix DNA binding protein
MKATGIVRRVDDLGRIVIPKEIRRVMRMREGELFVIYTNDRDCVIFRKCSYLDDEPIRRQIEEDEAEKRAAQESLSGNWW